MNPLPAARALCWVKKYQPHLQAATVHAFYDACWVGAIDLSTPQVVLHHAPSGIDTAGLEAAIAIEAITAPHSALVCRPTGGSTWHCVQ